MNARAAMVGFLLTLASAVALSFALTAVWGTQELRTPLGRRELGMILAVPWLWLLFSFFAWRGGYGVALVRGILAVPVAGVVAFSALILFALSSDHAVRSQRGWFLTGSAASLSQALAEVAFVVAAVQAIRARKRR
jgi:hypothetical protein